MAMDFAASLDAMLGKGRAKAAEQEAAVGAVKPVRSLAEVKRDMAAAKSTWEADTAKAMKGSILTVTAKPMALGVSVKKDSANVLTAVTKGSQGDQLGLKAGMTVMTIAGEGVSTSSEVTKALAAAKKKGRPYKIVLEQTKKAALERPSPSSTPIALRVQKALSTKERIPSGHKVTTVARGACAKASTPAEPKLNSRARKHDPAAEAEAKAKDKAAKEAKEEADAKARVADLAKRKEADAAESERRKKEAVELAAFKSDFRKSAAETMERQNGNVNIKYRQRQERCVIKQGMTTAAKVDNALALSAALPGCKVHLSELTPGQIELKLRALTESKGEEAVRSSGGRYAFFLREEPEGVFRGLLDGETYIAYINEDTAEEAAMMGAGNERGAETRVRQNHSFA